MARRRMTVKRIDPWSVLKFAVVVNLALLAVGMLVAVVVWMIIDRLQLVDQACSIALDVGFTACGVNAGNLFRAFILLGLLGVVVQTAVMVFLTFLYNLIADLTGGLTFGVVEEGTRPARKTAPGTTSAVRHDPAQRPGLGWAPGADTTARPPAARLDADAEPTSWTDGFVDEGAQHGDRRAAADRDDDLFGPR
ncbi:DUF3566 domain-containing protein [Egicoccus sp. AB-alg6-2]|uniref:DUF3566 domain-containing protein n=1 Tax=Egicoccus sp. AB-alg6-2 TaxID=3242692 RepID=UPI00359D17D4